MRDRSSGSCSSLADTCNAYVSDNPSAFTNAFWAINSVKVYQDGSATKRGQTPMAFKA